MTNLFAIHGRISTTHVAYGRIPGHSRNERAAGCQIPRLKCLCPFLVNSGLLYLMIGLLCAPKSRVVTGNVKEGSAHGRAKREKKFRFTNEFRH